MDDNELDKMIEAVDMAIDQVAYWTLMESRGYRLCNTGFSGVNPYTHRTSIMRIWLSHN